MEELSFMTLESAAKFEKNCLLVSKNDMMNLVNSNASSGPSKEIEEGIRGLEGGLYPR